MYKLYCALDNMYFSTVILVIGLIVESCAAFGPPPEPPGGRKKFRNAIAECKNKTNINEDEMQNVMRHVIPKTKNEQCMVACLEKKIGIMGDDNKISMEKVKEKFSHMKQHREDMYDKIMKNIEECRALETIEADECIAGRKFAECMYPKDSQFRPPHHFAPQFSNRYIDECKNKTGINENEFQNYIMRKIPETKNEQCMLACVEKRIGYIGADNKINITKVKQHLVHSNKRNPELYNKTLQIYTDCQAIETTETDECVAARKYAECVFPKQKQLHPPHHFGKAYENCKNKTGATNEEIKILHSPVIPKTKNAQCMLACVEKSLGVRGEDNKIIIEKLADSFRGMPRHNKEQYNKFIQIHKDCAAAETTEADECVAALKYAQCVRPKLESIA